MKNNQSCLVASAIHLVTLNSLHIFFCYSIWNTSFSQFAHVYQLSSVVWLIKVILYQIVFCRFCVICIVQLTCISIQVEECIKNKGRWYGYTKVVWVCMVLCVWLYMMMQPAITQETYIEHYSIVSLLYTIGGWLQPSRTV